VGSEPVKATIHGVVLNHGTVDTWGPHTRFCVPIDGFGALAEVPEERWPDRLPMVNVQTALPSTVLIESPLSTTMLRIYPGATPGESVIHMTEGTWSPLDDEAAVAMARGNHETDKRVLKEEVFPGAEACQRGFEAGLDTMVAGTGESAVAHWHRVWDEITSRAG
jgi:hypothetical protein